MANAMGDSVQTAYRVVGGTPEDSSAAKPY